jgi:hypothetical protein
MASGITIAYDLDITHADTERCRLSYYDTL